MDNKYLKKIDQSFESVKYHIDYMKEFLCDYIIDMKHFVNEFYYNIDDINYTLLELDIRIRALRDKLENG